LKGRKKGGEKRGTFDLKQQAKKTRPKEKNTHLNHDRPEKKPGRKQERGGEPGKKYFWKKQLVEGKFLLPQPIEKRI